MTVPERPSAVTRSIPEDTAREFLAVAKWVPARSDAEAQLEGHTVEALPRLRTWRCEEVEPIALGLVPGEGGGLDGEVIAELDREG